MKSIWMTLALILATGLAIAKSNDSSGTVKGVVKEANGEVEVPVPFANVFLLGTNIGGSTDFDGNFEFNAAPGNYKLVVTSLGYAPDTLDIQVAAGEVIEQEINVQTNAQLLETFEIQAKVNRESESLLLMEQKEATAMKQSIGASELSNKGASDVEQGIAKMSGVAKSNASNDIFVRGLGDRYNNASLNGLPIPSSDPDKKVIPLSIFPTSVVQSVDVSKTASASLPADFTGASININTKDYYEDPYAEVGFSLGYNSITTFQDFQQAQGDSLSQFGFGYTSRALPQEIDADYQRAYYQSPADETSPVFTRAFNPVQKSALPNYGVSILGGNSYDINDNSFIGFMVSGEHGSKHQYQSGFARNTDSSGVDKNYFATESFDYQTQSTTLGNVFYQINKRNQIQVNGLYTHNTSDKVSNYDSQILDRDRNTYTYSVRNTLRVNTLATVQLLGTHETKNNALSMNWGGSYNIAHNDEPDRSQLLYEASDETKSDYRLEALNASDNHRFFASLTEKEMNARADVNWNFKREESGKAIGTLSVGVQPRFKSRSFEWRQFNMSMRQYADSLQNNDIIVDQMNPDAFLGNEQYTAGLYSYEEARDGSRVHFADQNVLASYLMLNYKFGTRLTMLAGARVEKTSQEIRYKQLRNLLSDPYEIKSYDTLNILPSVSLKYEMTEKSNLRFAVSQTVSRPNFRELAPFQYQDQSRRLYEGNLDLVNSYSYNADIKYEVFPGLGEVFAIGVFGKYIDNPIERYEVPSSTTLFTYFNLGHVIVAGIESEIKTTVGRFVANPNEVENRFVDRISLGLNMAYNYTQLSVETNEPINTSKGTILATNATRPMQGASPYIVSADAGYEFNVGSIESRWSVVYNVFGPRVFLAGTYGRGDVYERPVNTVDLVLKNKVSDRIDVDLSVKNLLNPSIVQEQVNAGETFIFNEYQLGTTIGLGVNYRFFKSEE